MRIGHPMGASGRNGSNSGFGYALRSAAGVTKSAAYIVVPLYLLTDHSNCLRKLNVRT
jgi:hypothetical protein